MSDVIIPRMFVTQTMTIQIPEKRDSLSSFIYPPRSNRSRRLCFDRSGLRFLPFPRKTPYVHTSTPTFIRSTACLRVSPPCSIGARSWANPVWRVSTGQDFDMNPEVFPDVATANRPQPLRVIVTSIVLDV